MKHGAEASDLVGNPIAIVERERPPRQTEAFGDVLHARRVPTGEDRPHSKLERSFGAQLSGVATHPVEQECLAPVVVRCHATI